MVSLNILPNFVVIDIYLLQVLCALRLSAMEKWAKLSNR